MNTGKVRPMNDSLTIQASRAALALLQKSKSLQLASDHCRSLALALSPGSTLTAAASDSSEAVAQVQEAADLLGSLEDVEFNSAEYLQISSEALALLAEAYPQLEEGELRETVGEVIDTLTTYLDQDWPPPEEADPEDSRGLAASVETLRYNPNQARAPRGTPQGGKWIDTPGSQSSKLQSALAGVGGSRNPNSLGESIKLSPEDIEAMRSSAITGKHIGPDGKFTPEREALHTQIVETMLQGIEPAENPVLYMNGGGPGSGKSAMTTGPNAALTKYPTMREIHGDGSVDLKGMPNPEAALIDPDGMKLQLPETQRWREAQKRGEKTTEEGVHPDRWAGEAHEESSYLAKRVYRAALDRGVNVVYDGTGDGSVSSVMSKATAARESGYEVQANYVYLEGNEGLRRAIARGQNTGRIVPSGMLKNVYKTLPDTFKAAVAAGAYDSARLFDNNGGKGKAKVIAEVRGTEIVVLDQEAYARWESSPGRVE